MNPGDFVVAVRNFDGIVPRSVGLVKRVNGDLDVFFVGRGRMVNCPVQYVEWFDIDKTGKPKTGEPFSKKICNMCHLLKSNNAEFQRNQNDASGRSTTRPSCNECRIEIDGKALSHQERRRMNRFKPASKTIFTCPLCEKRTIVDVTVKVTADHSPRSGKGRQWICDSCNTGLGRFKDNIVFLEKVISYLKQFG